MEGVPYALVVRDAYKTYGRGKKDNVVLNRINMEVKSGQIYALLGASGCGKTTLLTCVLGIRKLDSGQIRILGQPPDGVRVVGGRVGYMPQEVSLYMEFSAREMMAFFGRLHGMGRKDVRDRMDFLSRFLKLPDLDLPIHALSGGQQRRVSFAVSLFRQPELLILDEPTVGVDAILRQAIWDHLAELTALGTTVILTTHYIGEASRADVVGFMQNGRLVGQDSPKNMLQIFGKTNLEDVFVSLCLQDQPPNAVQAVPGQEIAYSQQVTKSFGKKATFYDHVGALLFRNWKRVQHYIALLSLFVVSPLLVMTLFCAVLGGPPRGLNFGVVNQEWPTEPICQTPDGCSLANLSCRFLAHLDQQLLQLKPYTDDASAVSAVIQGEAWGYVSFPANYSKYIMERVWNATGLDAHDLEQSVATFKLDSTNKPIALTIQKTALVTNNLLVTDVLATCNNNTLLATPPVQFGSAILGSSMASFQDFALPGMLSMLVFSMSMTTGAVFVTIERMEGMLPRTWVTGLTDLELLTSELLTQYLLLLLQFAPVLPLMYWHLGLSPADTLHHLAPLMALQGTSSIAQGLLLSTLLPGLSSTCLFSMSLCLFCWFSSGTIWPLESVSGALEMLCWANPCTWYAEGYRDALVRGRIVFEHTYFLYGSIWAVVSMSSAIVAFRHLKFR